MEKSISVDVVFEFLRKNNFARSEAALRSEIGIQHDLNEFMQDIKLEENYVKELSSHSNLHPYEVADPTTKGGEENDTSRDRKMLGIGNKVVESKEPNSQHEVASAIMQDNKLRTDYASVLRDYVCELQEEMVQANKLRGDYASEYTLLRDYICELQRTNPDTSVKLEVENESNSLTRKFKRIYICLGALKKGFKAGLRDLLGLDGTLIEGPFAGKLLIAVGIDPNHGTYPVAYAIVEAETTRSWSWFLECLGDDLDLSPNSNFTFISDRENGIVTAIAKVFPCAEHRYCLMDIHKNMAQLWKGKVFKDHLWKCAAATTVPHFEKAMEDLKSLSIEAYEWLKQIPPHHWTRSHFTGKCRSDVLLNNVCEVFFNRQLQLVDGRDKPIITTLEYIREYLMKRIVDVHKLIDETDGPLTPTTTKILSSIKEEATKYTVLWNGGDKYQVSVGGLWTDQCIVDFKYKVCSCRRWELIGIPCKHAVATLWNMATNGADVGLPEDFVHPSYWLDTWKEMYSFKIGPINGRMMWPKSECTATPTPPKHHTQIGGPNKKRKKTVKEMSQQGSKITSN